MNLLRVPAFATRGIPNMMTHSLPDAFYLPPSFPRQQQPHSSPWSHLDPSPQSWACRIVLMLWQLQELIFNADNMHLEKKLDEIALPMTFFSSVCPDKKETSSAWSTQCQTRCFLRMWSLQLLMSILSLTFNWVFTALFLYICFRAEQTNFTYMTSKQLFTFLEAVWRQ